jgi:hypothetical protein
MPGVENTVLNLINSISPFAYLIIAVGIIGNLIFTGVGGQESREKAKKALPWVAVSGVAVLLAIPIANWFVGNIAF